MEYSSNFLEQTKRRRELIKQGIPTFIPIHDYFPRIKHILPGFIPKDYVIVTANSGVGKSRFARFLFIKVPLIMQTKNPKFKVNIILNSLEESEEKVEATFILSRLYRYHGIKLTFYELNHFSEIALDDNVMEKIEESVDFYSEHIRPYLNIVIEPDPKKFYKHCLKQLKNY